MTTSPPIPDTNGDFSVGHGDRSVQIGRWSFAPELHRLRCRDKRVHLEPQVAKLLAFLARNAGCLVTKEEILDHVWDGRFLSDSALTRTMTELRKALGDDARNPLFIQTVPKSGYRLIAPTSQSAATKPAAESIGARWRSPKVAVPLVLLAASALSAAGFVASRSRSESDATITLPAAQAVESETPTATAESDTVVLAVLPLNNLSQESAQDYFAEGMTDALIAELTESGALDVISRHSVDRLLVDDRPLLDVARLIGVDAVVEGSVVRQQDRVRINVRLTEIDRQAYSWAGSYERKISDVLSLQSEVSRAISQEVRQALVPESTTEIAPAGRAVDPAAYEIYLQAMQQLHRCQEQGPNQAAELFRKVLQIDPDYAPALAGLADYYSRLAVSGHLSPREAQPEVERAARRALALDANLPQVHVALATMETTFGWNWAAAENHFLKAIELNQHHAQTRRPYAYFLAMMGRFDEALVQARKAAQLDPLSDDSHITLAHIFFHAGRHDEVEQVMAEASKLSGTTWQHSYQLWSRAVAGRFDLALPGLRQAAENAHSKRMIKAAVLAWTLVGAGEMAEAADIRRQLETSTEDPDPYAMAILYTGFGEADLAFAALDEAILQRSPDAPYLKVEPFLVPLRTDPRFSSLVARLGLL